MHQLEFDTHVRQFLEDAKVELCFQAEPYGPATYSLTVRHKGVVMLRLPLWREEKDGSKTILSTEDP